MLRPILKRRISALIGAGALAGMLAACVPDDPPPHETPAASVPLGLMTSLPLYWPLGADMATLAGGTAPVPWQRAALETRYRLVPLDTLSLIPGTGPDDPGTDPLGGLTLMAVIQPRGLSPEDNVALDAWVRGGGRLLLVLDPLLTGDYHLPLGDPRRPSDVALIPPVLARWGLAIRFDEEQSSTPVQASLAGQALPLVLAGEVRIADPAAANCTLAAKGAAAVCRVGKGRVTLIADAALFEHPELAGEDGSILLAVLAAAVE